VVDDDPTLLSTVVDILELEDYEVKAASDGAKGLDLVDQVMPTLIILDMRMPVLNGGILPAY
jgi:DNA-binding response OmpR family regulator